MERRKRILTLHLKREWFEKIKSGEKTVEYRAVTDHWRDMLVGRTYDEIHFPQFGHGNVPVFAIDVSVKLS